MRFSILIGALALAMGPVCFGALPTVPDVAVCVKNSYLAPPGILERAKHMATGMFKAAGVNLIWVETEEAGRRTGAPLYLDVTLETSPSWSARKRSDALAQARPFALNSDAITIRYDRLLQTIGPVRLGAEVVASSYRYDDAANTKRLAGYGILNLTLEWDVARSWTLFVRGNNVFDQDYQLAADFSTGGATVFGGVRWRP